MKFYEFGSGRPMGLERSRPTRPATALSARTAPLLAMAAADRRVGDALGARDALFRAKAVRMIARGCE
jgi:hypothetical protein